MPVPIRVRDNETQVRVKPKGDETVKVESNCSINIKALESELKKEKEERIAEDENLQHQIDDLTTNIQLDFTDDEGELITVEQTGEQIRLKTICLKHKVPNN